MYKEKQYAGESFVQHSFFAACRKVLARLLVYKIPLLFWACSLWLYMQFGMYVSAFVNLRNRCSTWWFWTHGDV